MKNKSKTLRDAKSDPVCSSSFIQRRQLPLAAESRDFTVDISLLVQLGDAQQVGALLLAADPGFTPRQRRLEVELVAAVSQRVRVPEGFATAACREQQRGRTCSRSTGGERRDVIGQGGDDGGQRTLDGTEAPALVRSVVVGGGAPQVAVLAADVGALVEPLAVVQEGEEAGPPVRVTLDGVDL